MASQYQYDQVIDVFEKFSSVGDLFNGLIYNSILESMLAGTFFYLIAIILALWCYRLYSPMYERTFLLIITCWIGHYIGTFCYTLLRTDSLMQFFLNAQPHFHGLGTPFICNMVWYVRHFITGDSYTATLYFFASFSFLGSVLWYLLFLQLAQILKINNQKLIFPALIIMCWPSYFVFTAGIGKDSLTFFLIPVFLLSMNQLVTQQQKKPLMIFNILLSVTLLTLMRPYLLMIILAAYFLSTFKNIKSISGLHVILMLFIAPLLVFAIFWVLKNQAGTGLNQIQDISNMAVHQQTLLNEGTSFPMLSTNPAIVFLLLPYSFAMNLTMPLFIFAHSAITLFASFENSFLLYLIYQSWRRRKIYKIIKQTDGVRLCFSFFIVGMSFLSLINTNLGLATRQKTMYVPALLVVMMLMWQYNKQKKQTDQKDRHS